MICSALMQPTGDKPRQTEAHKDKLKQTGTDRAGRENERETSTNNNNYKCVTYSQRQPLCACETRKCGSILIAPLLLLVAREKINTENFTPLHFWAHLLMHEWLANLYTHFMLLSTIRRPLCHQSLLFLLYCTILNVYLWIKNFLPLMDHFAWRTVIPIWHVITLKRTFH